MVFLDKILNSTKSREEPAIDNKYNDNPVKHYRDKYVLMEQNGKGIIRWKFEQSVDKKWPYPVATEAERKALSYLSKQALKGHAIDISELLYHYVNGMLEDSDDIDDIIYKDLD